MAQEGGNKMDRMPSAVYQSHNIIVKEQISLQCFAMHHHRERAHH